MCITHNIASSDIGACDRVNEHTLEGTGSGRAMSIPVSIRLFVFPHIYISQVYSRSIFVLVSVTLHFHALS